MKKIQVNYLRRIKIDRKRKGTLGESIAAQYLIDHGFKILKKNFHFGRYGEVDLIAKKNSILVFIEVKTRTGDEYGDPLLSITPGKVRKLRKSAEGYMKVNGIYDTECRFDVITVDLRPNTPKLKHLKNAF